MLALDRVQGAGAGAELARYRAILVRHVLAQHYDAGGITRRTHGWLPSSGDPNAVTGFSMRRLANVARDLVRNNGHAQSALQVIQDDVVGWGIRAAVEDTRWLEWADSQAVDADGRCDFAGFQAQAIRTIAESGAVLIRRRRRRLSDGLPLPLQLQMLEPDFIDTEQHRALPNGGRIIRGIEYSPIGQRVAYWLFREHPGSTLRTTATSVRVPADSVLHVFRADRPGQVHGFSWFAPVLLRFRDFDEYADATLMAKKIQAAFAAFVSDLEGEPLGEEKAAEPDWDFIEPGTIKHLKQGSDVSFPSPPSVRDHESYTGVTLREIAVGLGVQFEDMTGDYCVAPETRVLMSDLRWVRADELRAGDDIVAFDEHRPGKGQFRKHRRATVVRAGRRDLPRIAVRTDRATVRVSTDHAFLCVRPTKGTGSQWRMHQWVRAEELVPGDKILYLARPWEEGRSRAHGYLRGIADGEGWVDRNRGSVGISQKKGAVFDEIGRLLAELGFEASERCANGSGETQQWDMHRMPEALRFLGEVRPLRLLPLADCVYEGKAIVGGRGKQSIYATVESAEPEGVGAVVTLETTTHTVVTEGLYSHNTNMPFSAARMSRLRHFARVSGWRWRMLIPQMLAGIYGWAVDAATLAGHDLPAKTDWTPPPMAMSDPEREGKAIVRNLRAGISTFSSEIRAQGYNVSTYLDKLQADFEELDRRGLELDSDPRKMTQQGQRQSQPDSDQVVNALSEFLGKLPPSLVARIIERAAEEDDDGDDEE